MKFYKFRLKLAKWLPWDYACSPLSEEDFKDKVLGDIFEDAEVEEINSPPHMWLKRHIEAMVVERDNLSDIINLYKTKL